MVLPRGTFHGLKSNLHPRPVRSVSTNIHSAWESYDLDGDGRVSLQELLQASYINNLKRFFQNIPKTGSPKNYGILFQSISQIFSIREILIVAALLLGHKLLLRSSYKLLKRGLSFLPEYQNSLFGYIERPITLLMWSLPFFCLLDICSLSFQFIGLEAKLVQKGYNFISAAATWLLVGSFLTRFKDWLFSKPRLLTKPSARDEVKEKLTDDITSLGIWAIVSFLCVGSLSLPLNFIGNPYIAYCTYPHTISLSTPHPVDRKSSCARRLRKCLSRSGASSSL